jgi:hypothetical protein
MDELAVGDSVLVADLVTGATKFEPVLGFIHVERNITISMYELVAESGERLVLSAYHLVFMSPTEMGFPLVDVQAMNARMGDYLWVISHDGTLRASRMVDKRQVPSTGAFGPITESATLVVDGVLASMHSGRSSFDGMHWVKEIFYKAYRAYLALFPDTKGRVPANYEFIRFSTHLTKPTLDTAAWLGLLK